MALARLFDFTAGQPIVSQQVDDEFNQIVNALNGTSTNVNLVTRFSSAADPVLKLDQLGAGPIQQFAQAGIVKASVTNAGSFSTAGQFISTLVTGTAPLSIASTTKVPNLNADLLDGKSLFEGDAVGIAQALNPLYNTIGNNAGSGDTDLHTRNLSGNMLGNDGAYLHVVMAGSIANNANAKRLRVTFGGTTVIDTGLTAALTNIRWRIGLTIIRFGSDTVKVVADFVANSNVFTSFAEYTQINSLGFGSAITLKAIANGVALNDVVQEITTFTLHPMV